MSVHALTLLVLLTPLIGGIAASMSGRRNAATLFLFLAFAFSVVLLAKLQTTFRYQFDWIPGYQLGIYVDSVSAVLLVLVCFISFLVHVFSVEYMRAEEGKGRYFLKLGFFTSAMIGLLIADHLILLFIFWELVGLASYLLIGFWYHKTGVPASAKQAFMINRVADVALLAGILLINSQQDSLMMSEQSGMWLIVPSLLVTIGALGKSAQLPFSGWLIKAMAGPTPVSALIHAATMVAAGVYLLFRLAPIFPSEVTSVIVLVGAITACYAGICAMTQHDIKRVLAYSTISQLGYMILGIGVGAGEASLFHLWTHAFFKAGLFLSAGSIVHYMKLADSGDVKSIDPQDMRNMGGLRVGLPWTFFTFLVCGLALAGIPFFSGFMSKEGIILSTWAWADQLGTWAYLVPDLAFITVLFTSFYVGRMIFLVFLGENRLGLVLSFKESSAIKIPLVLLALGSFWLIYSWNPLAHDSVLTLFFGRSAMVDSFSQTATTLISILLSVGGLVLAYFLFQPNSSFSKMYHQVEVPSAPMGRLFFEGLYLTHIYEWLGRFTLKAANLTAWMDRKVLDGAIHYAAVGGVVFSKVLALVDRFVFDGVVNLSAWISSQMGRRFAGIHSRQVQWQLVWLLLAFVLILGWIFLFMKN